MRSRDDDNNKPEAAHEHAPSQPTPAQPRPAPAPAKPGLSLEERVERLEKRLVSIIGEL